MNSFQDRLNNYEVAPPSQVWEKIAASLDESELTSEFPNKLYNTELTPPVAAWENISVTLDSTTDTEQTKLVPLRSKSNSFIRYAAAAILIGLVAFGVIKWTNNTSNDQQTSSEIASSKKPAVSPGNNTTVPTVPEKIEPTTRTNNNAIAHLEQPVRTRHTRTNNRAATTASYNYNAPANEQYTNPIYAYESRLPNLADRYIMLMTPEGNIIRMSKKWGSLVCCVSGEEQDADCKSQLKKWQEKLASSPLAPSPGNFMDILSMVNSLEETEL